MSSEATVRVSLTIIKTSAEGSIPLLDYSSRPAAFNVDVTGTKGPTPGAFSVDTLGVDCDLSELTTPGLCRIMNQDETNYVEFGIFDPQTNVFYPLGEVGPGESYVLKLSRNILEEYSGTGTGTTGPTNTLRFKANTAEVNVLVEAFEK